MRLSQLLKLKQDLQTHTSNKAEGEINDHIAHVNQLAMGADRLPESELFQKINAEYRNMLPYMRKIEEIKQEKIKEIDEKISELAKGYFIDSYEMYEDQHKLADVATNRDIRRLYMYGNVKEIVKSRIYHYIDWRYPALEIGPGDGLFTESMAAGDPLYIVDVHQEFLDSTKKKFNEFYATRRLRSYLTHQSRHDLSMLPQEQIGFVLVWNVFNYFPLEAIKSYLKEIKKVVRPGGTIIFSYNNSDRWQGAEMVENAFMCHTPKHMLIPLVESLGFTVANSYDYDPTVSWVEIQKPGKLSTCKAHQSMGAVIQILDPDEDPKSIEARAQEELRVSLDAQTRFEIQRNRPDLIQQAKSYRDKFNVTLEKALEVIFEQEGLDLSEVHNYKNRVLQAQEKMSVESIEQDREENLRLAKKARSNND
jgi:ubiquinone/menaquinone biosynthesis C-methylase UbiE